VQQGEIGHERRRQIAESVGRRRKKKNMELAGKMEKNPEDKSRSSGTCIGNRRTCLLSILVA